MAEVKYQNKEDLVTALQDLEVRKAELSKTVDVLVDSNAISKKGMGRVMKILSAYPSPPKQKLNEANEGALLSTMMEIKNVQVSMLMLIDAINTLSKQGEKSAEV